MRNHPSPLSTYLNAGVIAAGILLGIWASHDRAASTPAPAPVNSVHPGVDRWDEAGTLPGFVSSSL